MADRGNRNPDREADDMTRGSGDEQIRGIADEGDDEFDDAEEMDDEEEEDEEGTI